MESFGFSATICAIRGFQSRMMHVVKKWIARRFLITAFMAWVILSTLVLWISQISGGCGGSDTAVKSFVNHSLRAPLLKLKIDIGRYPTTEEGLKLLRESPTDENLKALWKGPYLSHELPEDPWGHPYQYRYPASSSEADTIFSPSVWMGFPVATISGIGRIRIASFVILQQQPMEAIGIAYRGSETGSTK